MKLYLFILILLSNSALSYENHFSREPKKREVVDKAPPPEKKETEVPLESVEKKIVPDRDFIAFSPIFLSLRRFEVEYGPVTTKLNIDLSPGFTFGVQKQIFPNFILGFHYQVVFYEAANRLAESQYEVRYFVSEKDSLSFSYLQTSDIYMKENQKISTLTHNGYQFGLSKIIGRHYKVTEYYMRLNALIWDKGETEENTKTKRANSWRIEAVARALPNLKELGDWGYVEYGIFYFRTRIEADDFKQDSEDLGAKLSVIVRY